jgi:hypothetical protein
VKDEVNTGVGSGLTALFCSVVDPDPHGSVFIWLSRIRTWNSYPDPGAWKLAKIDKLDWFHAFQKGFCRYLVGKSVVLFPSLSIFFVI